MMSADRKVPFDPADLLARILDGSRFDEFKPLYGTALTTGWASLHGYPIGVLANVRGVLFSEEAQKAAQFIQLANQRDVPLLFVHNTTGFMVGKEYEQGGIVKHGAQMINAVSNSKVPHLGLIVGGSYGAANYAMSGRGYDPRFVFAWPSAQTAVMGPQQLAGVLSIVAKASAEARGLPFDEEGDARCAPTWRTRSSGSRPRWPTPAAATTTGSSTRATRARFSGSRFQLSTTPLWRDRAGSASSGCDVGNHFHRRLRDGQRP